MQTVFVVLRDLSEQLMAIPKEKEGIFMDQLSDSVLIFKQGTEMLSEIFRYLDKTYIELRLFRTLKQILMSHFVAQIFQFPPIKERWVFFITYLPSQYDPSKMMNFIKVLFETDQSKNF